MKHIIRLLLDFIIVLLSIFIIFKIIGTVNNKNGYPEYFGYTYFEIVSGSMEDAIQIKDYVIVKIDKNDLEKDDIISFKYEGVIVTHRIIDINNDEILTKGDNNNIEDHPITYEDVIGKVVYIDKKIGRLLDKVSNPKIFLIILSSVLVLEIIFGKEVKKREEKKKR
ncbi:MAG: signal peptidase I [Candidatus Coprovivens sp.]